VCCVLVLLPAGQVTRASKRRASVLLAGGDDRSMLAAGRSLSRRGIPFVAIGVEGRTMVGASRSVGPHVVGKGPSPGSDPGAYVDFLLEVVRRYDVDLVLPLTDRTLLACDRHREAIETETRLAAPSSYAIRHVNDKRVHLHTARRLGIPCPDQYELERLEDTAELIDQLGFPLVLKDPGPTMDGRPSPFDFTWLVARDEHELDRYLEERCPPGVFPMFQRLVKGEVRNVCCFGVEGDLVAVHEYRDIRRLGGLSVFREVVPVTPRLRRHAQLMLRELNWDGAAHLEFFVRDPDGDARYMETNGRLWASLEGPVGAGWDFPYWTYRYFTHGERPRPPSPSFRLGSRSRWHYGDLEALVGFLAGNDEPTGAGRSWVRAVVDYLSGFRPGVHPDVFRLDDPLPELIEHWRGIQKGVRQIPAARRLYRAVRRPYRALVRHLE
jgi:predicted ATP-grasp superfamily ATP-dependent carboligase